MAKNPITVPVTLDRAQREQLARRLLAINGHRDQLVARLADLLAPVPALISQILAEDADHTMVRTTLGDADDGEPTGRERVIALLAAQLGNLGLTGAKK